MDDTNQKTKSEMEKQIDDFFSEIRDIVIKSKDKDEAKENLEKFRNRQPDIAGSLNDVFELAEDYIEDGVNSSEQQKNFLTELEEKISKFRENREKWSNNLSDVYDILIEGTKKARCKKYR